MIGVLMNVILSLKSTLLEKRILKRLSGKTLPACPSCQSKQVIKRGFDDTEPARQRYECHDCDRRFDDLTDTIFAGHHQPLKVWILCLYFMGLNVSNAQIAHELSLNESDVYQMTT